MPSSGYTAIVFTANEQPTTAKWNLIGSNDSSFNLGTGLEDSTILTRHIAAANITAAKIEAQQSWQSVTPLIGTVTTTPGYFKDSLGIVHLRGQINSGTGTLIQLPVGYRPEQYKEYPTSSGGGFAVMSVDTSGNVVKITGGAGNGDLDLITFRAA